jgi:hypothetical protein
MTVLNFLYFFIFVINLIGLWMVFEKAGYPGWSAFIPFYNVYILVRIVDLPIVFILFYLIPVINIMAHAYTCFKLAQCFNKGVVYTVGLFLAPFFFIPILGFGKSRFTGIPLRMMSL